MNTYDYEDSLFMIDPNLRELRDLKELYIQFNTRNSGKPMDARIELDELINYYLHCGNSIFVDFASILIQTAVMHWSFRTSIPVIPLIY